MLKLEGRARHHLARYDAAGSLGMLIAFPIGSFVASLGRRPQLIPMPFLMSAGSAGESGPVSSPAAGAPRRAAGLRRLLLQAAQQLPESLLAAQRLEVGLGLDGRRVADALRDGVPEGLDRRGVVACPGEGTLHLWGRGELSSLLFVGSDVAQAGKRRRAGSAIMRCGRPLRPTP